MRKRKGILIPWSHIVNKESVCGDVKLSQLVRFNSCTIVGAENSIMHHAIIVYLTHSEFEPVEEACITPLYHYNDAKRQYPYLFSDTNPLLYREFDS